MVSARIRWFDELTILQLLEAAPGDSPLGIPKQSDVDRVRLFQAQIDQDRIQQHIVKPQFVGDLFGLDQD